MSNLWVFTCIGEACGTAASRGVESAAADGYPGGVGRGMGGG